MKKLTKFLLILAVLLLVVGGGMTIAGVVLGEELPSAARQIFRSSGKAGGIRSFLEKGNHSVILVDDSEEWDDSYSATAIRNLELNLKADELTMRTWSKDLIQVDYQGEDRGKVKTTVEGDTIKITGSSRTHYSDLILYYPEDKQFEQVSIRVDVGEVEVEDELRTTKLQVTIGAGEFSADQTVETEKAEFSVGAGELSLDHLIAKDLNADCGLGSMNLTMEGAETDYNYTLKCGLGEISIGDHSSTAIGGKDEIKNSGANCNMNLKCGMGEIDIEFTK